MKVYLSRKHARPCFCIESDNEKHIDAFKTLYNASDKASDETPCVCIVIKSFHDRYLLSYGGGQIETDAPLQAALNIVFENTVYSPGILPLHAGAVEVNGRAFVFIAPTGTGKTTLVAYLAHKGYPYISDDRALVDMDTLDVAIDITPLRLRPESFPVLRGCGCAVEGKEVNIENIRRIVYTPEAVASGDLPIGGLFFIERSGGGENCRAPIPRGEAVQMIMRSQLSPGDAGSGRLKCAIKLAANCERLVYSDMGYVYGLLAGENAK